MNRKSIGEKGSKMEKKRRKRKKKNLLLRSLILSTFILLLVTVALGCYYFTSVAPKEQPKDVVRTDELQTEETSEIDLVEETEDVPEEIEITISATGDMTLGNHQKYYYEGSFDNYYDLYGVDYFMQNVKPIFEADDFTIVNVEGVLSDSTNIRTTKEWNLKGKPEYANILSGASVEWATLGNNHIMDYQEDGVQDTFDNLTNVGIGYAISTDWGNHYEIYETEKGIKIGVISVNPLYEGERSYAYLEQGYQDLRAEGADIMIAAMHWGIERENINNDEQEVMGHWCIDYGYDLVLGCHPHVIQGIECYNGKYIVYSMGNFCFGGNRNPQDKDTFIFQQTFHFVDGEMQEETSARAIPCRISTATDHNDYCPVILEGSEAEEMISHLNQYSEKYGISFDAEGYEIK